MVGRLAETVGMAKSSFDLALTAAISEVPSARGATPNGSDRHRAGSEAMLLMQHALCRLAIEADESDESRPHLWRGGKGYSLRSLGRISSATS